MQKDHSDLSADVFIFMSFFPFVLCFRRIPHLLGLLYSSLLIHSFCFLIQLLMMIEDKEGFFLQVGRVLVLVFLIFFPGEREMLCG